MAKSKKPVWVTRWGFHLKRGSAIWKWAKKNFEHRRRRPAPQPGPAPAPPPPPPGPVKGCDYVSGPSVAALKRAGIKFVFRYLSTAGNPKNATVGEIARLRSAGIKVGFVFETTGTTFKGGRTAGQHDARSALAQARELGIPDTVPIYFAVDTDPHGHEDVIVSYIRGAASVLGQARTGIYAGLTAVEACARAHACRWLWQTYAWSGGVWFSGNHVEQYQNGVRIGGAGVDLDRAVKTPYGAW